MFKRLKNLTDVSKRLTDFELAALSAVPGIIGGLVASAADVVWALKDHAVTPHAHLMPIAGTLAATLPLFILSAAILYLACRKHRRTGSKPIESVEDIDYRISLALAKKSFCQHTLKEKCLNKHNKH